MNNNTHPCAGKCSEFNNGEQCFFCLINETVNQGVYAIGRINSRQDDTPMATRTVEFKGGDWVVLANTISTESSLAQILKTDGRWSIIKWLDDNTESNVRLDFLRHATDEEIAAGRRMDNRVTVITPSGTQKVKGGMVAFVEMGDDEHIENHISPLCKTESQPGSIRESDNQIIERLKVENVVLQAEIDELQAENKILNQAAATRLRNQNQFMDLYNRLVEQLYPYAIDLEDPVDGDVNTPKEYMDGYNRAREIAHYNLLEMMESDVEYICAQCDMLGGGGEA